MKLILLLLEAVEFVAPFLVLKLNLWIEFLLMAVIYIIASRIAVNPAYLLAISRLDPGNVPEGLFLRKAVGIPYCLLKLPLYIWAIFHVGEASTLRVAIFWISFMILIIYNLLPSIDIIVRLVKNGNQKEQGETKNICDVKNTETSISSSVNSDGVKTFHYLSKPLKNSIYPEVIGHCEGVQFDINDSWAEFTVWLANPTEDELKFYQSGNVDLRFLKMPMGIWIAFKFGGLSWIETAYSPHLSIRLNDFTHKNLKRLLYNQGILVVVLDTLTGRVCHVDEIKLTVSFATALIDEIEKIKLKKVFDKTKYFEAVRRFQGRPLPQWDLEGPGINRMMIRNGICQ